MIKTELLKQSIRWILPYILPSVARCFMYVFVVIAAVWLSVASYYYFTEDATRSYGALLSGGMFGGVAIIALIWDLYCGKKSLKKDIFNEIMPQNYLLLKSLYSKVKDTYIDGKCKDKILLFIPLMAVIYVFLRKKR